MIAFTVFLVTDQSDNHSDKEAKNTEAIIDLTEVSTEKKETGEGNREWDNSSRGSEENSIESENVVKLREYFYKNYSNYTGKIYFVDFTGDGNDEMIFSYWVKDDDGDISIQRGITVLGYYNDEIVILWDDFVDDTYDFGRDYYLVQENEKYYLEYMSWKYVGNRHELTETKKVSFYDDYTCSITEDTHPSENGVVVLSSLLGNNQTINQEIEHSQQVVFLKNKTKLALEIARQENSFVVDDVYFVSNDADCYFYVTLNRDYSDLDNFDTINIWGSDGERIEKIDSIVLASENDANLEYYLKKCDIYQFGKNKHYFVEIEGAGYWVQHKYCLENGQFKILDDKMYFLRGENGRVISEYVSSVDTIDGGRIAIKPDYVDISYKEGTYVEYGVEKIDSSELKNYDNYEEIINCVEESLFQMKYIEDYYSASEFIPNKVKLLETLIAANNYIYLNYAVQGCDNEKNNLTVWAYATVFVSGNKLELIETKYGKKSNGSGLGLPLYYGKGRELEVPEVKEEEVAETETAKKIVIEFTWEGRYQWNGELAELELNGFEKEGNTIVHNMDSSTSVIADDGSIICEMQTSYTENEGRLIVNVYDVDSAYNLELNDNKGIDTYFSTDMADGGLNGIIDAKVQIKITDIDGKVTEIDTSEGKCIYRSYTAVWFLGLGIKNGKLGEYDSSWIGN